MTVKITTRSVHKWGFIFTLCVVTCWYIVLTHQTGSVIVDGFQSLGAISNSKVPGSLHWPLVGSFMGYDHTWGFHWVGWPMLRSLLLPFVPWHPLIEITLLCLLWAVTAWIVMRTVDRLYAPTVKLWTGLLTIAAPGFLVAAQSYRPEIVTALFLVIALQHWHASEAKQKAWRVIALFLLPIIHPSGLVVPVAWISWDALWICRGHGFIKAVHELIRKSWPLCLGAVALVSWFAFQPEAWAQFQLNVKSQRLLVEGMGTGWSTLFRWGLGSKGALPLIALMVGALVSSLLLVVPFLKKKCVDPCNTPLWYAAVGLGIALLFNVAAKNPNSLHLVAVLPLAVLLYVEGIHRMARSFAPIAIPWAMVATLIVFLVHPLKFTYKLTQNNGQSYRGELAKSMQQLPRARKVFIPVAFWEAALQQPQDNNTEYQFSTFPNILERSQRMRYENEVVATLQQGDLLVWDPLQESGGIFNFVKITALRHVIYNPNDESQWERLPDIDVPVSYSRSQAVHFEVYRKR
jgi:hypothetical protein